MIASSYLSTSTCDVIHLINQKIWFIYFNLRKRFINIFYILPNNMKKLSGKDNICHQIKLFLSYCNVETGYSLVKLLCGQAQFYYITHLNLAQNMHIAIAKTWCLSDDIEKLLKVKLKQSKQYDLATEF